MIKLNEKQILVIAEAAHEANMAYCCAMGDYSQRYWDDAPDWQRESATKGVTFLAENPSAPPSASHDSWLKEKLDSGWKYGPEKDPEKKEHPCCVSYEELPLSQRAKDVLFQAVVKGLIARISEQLAAPETAK